MTARILHSLPHRLSRPLQQSSHCPFRAIESPIPLDALSRRRSRFHSTLTPISIASLLSPQPGHSQHSSIITADASAAPCITVNGFVRSVRKQKRVAFAAVGDGSSLQTIQAVLSPEQAENLSTGVAVAITGQWTPSPGQGQTHELVTKGIRILGGNDAASSPLQKKYQTSEYLRTLPHLRSRLPFNALLLRLRSQVIAQMTQHFSNLDFVQVHPPLITSSDCEGAGEVFTVSPDANPPPNCIADGQAASKDQFFQAPKYLTVSSQLHLEAFAQSVNKVWTLSPTFRAEKSDTPRHLSEFYMLEAELTFVEDMAEVMDVVEDMLRAIARHLQSSYVGQELLQARRKKSEPHDGDTISEAGLAQRWQGLVDGPWPRIEYNEAIVYLMDAVAQGEVCFDFPPDHAEGLQTEHERFLAEKLGRGGPVFVMNYPQSIKPFYMAPSKTADGDTRQPTVACFDLLVPEICELVGGSMREHRLAELVQAMDERGLRHSMSGQLDGQMSDGPLEWYLDLRRYGSVPHGGFGLGFDRLLCYLSGVSNIKDVVSFPRWHKRCDC